MVGPPAMVGRRPAKIPPAWTQGPGMGAPRVPAGGILAGRRPTMAGASTIHHIIIPCSKGSLSLEKSLISKSH